MKITKAEKSALTNYKKKDKVLLKAVKKDIYENICEHNRMSWFCGNACAKCKKLKAYEAYMTGTPIKKLPSWKKDELVVTLEEYAKFLSKYISDHAVYLHIHGFTVKAADIKKGKGFRAKIAKLKKEIYE